MICAECIEAGARAKGSPLSGYCDACGFALESNRAHPRRHPGIAPDLFAFMAIVGEVEERISVAAATLTAIEETLRPWPALRVALFASGPVDTSLAAMAIDRFESARRAGFGGSEEERSALAARVVHAARIECASGVRVLRASDD